MKKLYTHHEQAMHTACLLGEILYFDIAASALQWKAFHASKETQEMTLCQAETEAKHALELVTIHYGEISLRTAQIYSLLGQIYSKMER